MSKPVLFENVPPPGRNHEFLLLSIGVNVSVSCSEN